MAIIAANDARHRAGDDSRRSARPPERDRGCVRRRRRRVPVRAARDRPRPARRPRRFRRVSERTRLDRLLAAIPVAVRRAGRARALRMGGIEPKDADDLQRRARMGAALACDRRTGHAAALGEPRPFKSIYAYLIAPAWWSGSVGTGYALIKYLDAVLMCLTAVPVYFLARLARAEASGDRCCVRVDPHLGDVLRRVPAAGSARLPRVRGGARTCVSARSPAAVAAGRSQRSSGASSPPKCAVSWRRSPARTRSRRSCSSSQARQAVGYERAGACSTTWARGSSPSEA